MPKISDERLKPIQLKLFESDWEYLTEMYGEQGGINKVIRTLIRSFVKKNKNLALEMIDEMERKT